MAVLFSKVKTVSGDKEADFFVGGIPRGRKDLIGYTAFDAFASEVANGTIEVYVKRYCYGEGKIEDATPAEIAYFMKRIEMHSDFLKRSCESFGVSSFNIAVENGVYNEPHPKLIGHSVKGNKNLRSVEDVAKFICNHVRYGDVTVTYEDGAPFLSTYGTYVDKIVDMEYREKLLAELVPLQSELVENHDKQEIAEETPPVIRM